MDAARAASERDRTALERSLRLAKRGVKSEAAVEDSRSTLASSQANEQVRAVDLSMMTVTAPFDGIAGPSNVEVGSFVSAGYKIVHLVDRSNLRVSFRVAEKVLPKLHTGLPIEASAESIGAAILGGKVTLIDPTVEMDSRSVLLRADIDAAGRPITPGLFVRVNLILRERDNALLIPKQALMASLSGNFVYRIDNGAAHRVRVEVGEREDAGALFESGHRQAAIAGHHRPRSGRRPRRQHLVARQCIVDTAGRHPRLYLQQWRRDV